MKDGGFEGRTTELGSGTGLEEALEVTVTVYKRSEQKVGARRSERA